MELIHARKFSLRVSPTCIGILAFSLLFGSVARLCCALAALMIHEASHLLVALLLGRRFRRLELTPFGGVLDADELAQASKAERVCIAAAGSIGSLTLGCALLSLAGTSRLLCVLALDSLFLGVFNLLPVFPLDGARILLVCAEQTKAEPPIRKLLMALSWGLGFALILLAAFAAWQGVCNPSLMAIGPCLCVEARRAAFTERFRLLEYRFKRREALRKGRMLRSSALVCDARCDGEQLAREWAKQAGYAYQFVVAVDSESGEIVRCRTEMQLPQAFTEKEKDLDASL